MSCSVCVCFFPSSERYFVVAVCAPLRYGTFAVLGVVLRSPTSYDIIYVCMYVCITYIHIITHKYIILYGWWRYKDAECSVPFSVFHIFVLPTYSWSIRLQTYNNIYIESSSDLRIDTSKDCSLLECWVAEI